MISAILFISFFIFLILGVPIGICLGLSSVCAILYSGTSLTIVATNMYSGISKFLLLAIPFFVLSGNIMAKAGISKRLIIYLPSFLSVVIVFMLLFVLLSVFLALSVLQQKSRQNSMK